MSIYKGETRYTFDKTKPFVLDGENGQDVIACLETLCHSESDEFGASNAYYRRYVVINNTPSKEEVFKFRLMRQVQKDI